jgi:uncharacterized membrane protein
MLAVSTFSLNIMVTAHRAAAEMTTPRVQRILLEDTTTQSVLSTFIGAFVFSLASIVLYQSKFYSDETAIFVMGITICIIVLVVVSMLRWINHLKGLGSVDNSIEVVCLRAETVLSNLARTPTFGATEITADTIIPTSTTEICAKQSGYIQLIDIPRLQDCLPSENAIYITHRPGRHVLKGQRIAHVSGHLDPQTFSRMADAFTIGDARTFEQDASYGLTVLSEIGSKALSPGVNDAGTAIAALHALTRLLWSFGQTAPSNHDRIPNVFMPAVDYSDLLYSAYIPIARDGAENPDVATTIRASLSDLATCGRTGMEAAARNTARQALEFSEHASLLQRELDSIKTIKV